MFLKEQMQGFVQFPANQLKFTSFSSTQKIKQTNKKKMLKYVWMFVSSQNSQVEILTPKAMVSQGGAFGKWLGHERD